MNRAIISGADGIYRLHNFIKRLIQDVVLKCGLLYIQKAIPKIRYML